MGSTTSPVPSQHKAGLEENWFTIFSIKDKATKEIKNDTKNEIVIFDFDEKFAPLIKYIKPTTTYSYNNIKIYSNLKGIGITNYYGGKFYMMLQKTPFRELSLGTIIEYWPVEKHNDKLYYAGDDILLEKELIDMIASTITHPHVFKSNNLAIFLSILDDFTIIIKHPL
jgi:hypothetical protein